MFVNKYFKYLQNDGFCQPAQILCGDWPVGPRPVTKATRILDLLLPYPVVAEAHVAVVVVAPR